MELNMLFNFYLGFDIILIEIIYYLFGKVM